MGASCALRELGGVRLVGSRALSLLDEGRGDEAADLFVSEHKAWMRPAMDDRGPLYVDFCNKFVPELEKVCGRDGAKLRANPAACKKEFNTMLKAGGIWDGYDKLRDYHGKAANTNKVGESLSQWSSYLYRYHSADAPS